MRVFHDWINVLRIGRAGLEVMRALTHAPAVVAALGDNVHLFPQILAHIANPQVAGLAVPTVTPWITEAVSVDFVVGTDSAHVRLIHKRIVPGNAVLQLVLMPARTDRGS